MDNDVFVCEKITEVEGTGEKIARFKPKLGAPRVYAFDDPEVCKILEVGRFYRLKQVTTIIPIPA